MIREKEKKFNRIKGEADGLEYSGLTANTIGEFDIKMIIMTFKELIKKDKKEYFLKKINEKNSGRNLLTYLKLEKGMAILKTNYKKWIVESGQENFKKNNTIAGLMNEFYKTKALESISNIPKPLALIKIKSNDEEYSQRVMTLYEYKRMRNILEIVTENYEIYFETLIDALNSSLSNIHKIHLLGFTHNDIYEKNIGISISSNKTYIYDFEMAKRISDKMDVLNDLKMFKSMLERIYFLTKGSIDFLKYFEKWVLSNYGEEVYNKYKNK